MAGLTKIDFKNTAAGNTPINKDNLNQMQTNVENFGKDIVTETNAKITTLETQVGDISNILDVINGEVV